MPGDGTRCRETYAAARRSATGRDASSESSNCPPTAVTCWCVAAIRRASAKQQHERHALRRTAHPLPACRTPTCTDARSWLAPNTIVTFGYRAAHVVAIIPEHRWTPYTSGLRICNSNRTWQAGIGWLSPAVAVLSCTKRRPRLYRRRVCTLPALHPCLVWPGSRANVVVLASQTAPTTHPLMRRHYVVLFNETRSHQTRTAGSFTWAPLARMGGRVPSTAVDSACEAVST